MERIILINNQIQLFENDAAENILDNIKLVLYFEYLTRENILYYLSTVNLCKNADDTGHLKSRPIQVSKLYGWP